MESLLMKHSQNCTEDKSDSVKEMGSLSLKIIDRKTSLEAKLPVYAEMDSKDTVHSSSKTSIEEN